jgi:hypothetical protein
MPDEDVKERPVAPQPKKSKVMPDEDVKEKQPKPVKNNSPIKGKNKDLPPANQDTQAKIKENPKQNIEPKIPEPMKEDPALPATSDKELPKTQEEDKNTSLANKNTSKTIGSAVGLNRSFSCRASLGSLNDQSSQSNVTPLNADKRNSNNVGNINAQKEEGKNFEPVSIQRSPSPGLSKTTHASVHSKSVKDLLNLTANIQFSQTVPAINLLNQYQTDSKAMKQARFSRTDARNTQRADLKLNQTALEEIKEEQQIDPKKVNAAIAFLCSWIVNSDEKGKEKDVKILEINRKLLPYTNMSNHRIGDTLELLEGMLEFKQ